MTDINPDDIDSLADVIRQVDGNHDLGAGALAEAILGEWGLIINYERVVAAAQAHRDQPGDWEAERELDAALAPFEEAR